MPLELPLQQLLDVPAILRREPAALDEHPRERPIPPRGPLAAHRRELLRVDQLRLKTQHAEQQIAIGVHENLAMQL